MTSPFPYSPAPYSPATLWVQSKTKASKAGILPWLVLLYVALLQIQVTFDPGATGFRVAPADLCLVAAAILVPGQLKYRKPAWCLWHAALLIVFAIGTMMQALQDGDLNRYTVLNKDIGLVFLYLSYLTISTVATSWQDIRKILKVFTVSVAAQNVIAVAAYLVAYSSHTDNIFTAYDGARLAGLMVDPNAYGGLLVTALVLCEGSSWGPKPLLGPWMRVFVRTSLGLGILFTFSRSAWLALALALLLLCIIRRGMALRFAVVGLVGLAAVFLLMGARFLGFFQDMASRPEQVAGRFELLDDAWAQFAANPWFGGGLASFFMKEGIIVHNTAFWFLADFGIVGLLVLLGFVTWFFRRSWSAFRLAPREEKPVMLAMALAHVALLGLTVGIEGFYQRQWWMILALIATGYTLARKSAKSVQAGPRAKDTMAGAGAIAYPASRSRQYPALDGESAAISGGLR
ncbi:MAG TPA: O-antigen ligase family protein [Bryobacteraceae bacterium]|nr:O-antigen ligase family protein [Bryobacteraceae bacterium]